MQTWGYWFLYSCDVLRDEMPFNCNFTFFYSNNMFIINHVLKFKYQPSQIKVKLRPYRVRIHKCMCLYFSYIGLR